MENNALQQARAILNKEIAALERTRDRLDDGFERSVQLIRSSKGKVVVTGIGKSGLIGQKIAATMSSMGTLAISMHSTDAIHGDLGMVAADDVVLAISHSGRSAEILALVKPIRNIGARLVAMVGNCECELAKAADCAICLDVPEEADHLNCAPTSSALAALAVGDALAIILSELRHFRHEDFAVYHPGGMLGRRLLMTVKDLMHVSEPGSALTPASSMDDVLEELTSKKLGGANVMEDLQTRKLAGFISDGDLKRQLRNREKFFDLTAGDIMTRNPVTVRAEDKASQALELMENRPSQIYVLPVVDAEGRAMGILRMHDLVSLSANR